MNEELIKFLLARIKALEEENRNLTNSNLVKIEQIENIRGELSHLINSKKL
tara:strand:+ start:688 stop:840 length:153 start_codon:yes stop_codon:yes gene_type:complete